MDDRDRSGDRPRHARDGGDRREGGGPPGSDWLQLEVSRVMYGRAESFTVQVAEEILREAVKARLRERLGPRLEAIARIAADRFADDVEANLDIEAKITERTDARRGIEQLVDAALGRGHGDEGGATPPGEATGEGWDPRKI